VSRSTRDMNAETRRFARTRQASTRLCY